jgi:hypothetical protein
MHSYQHLILVSEIWLSKLLPVVLVGLPFNGKMLRGLRTFPLRTTTAKQYRTSPLALFTHFSSVPNWSPFHAERQNYPPPPTIIRVLLSSLTLHVL